MLKVLCFVCARACVCVCVLIIYMYVEISYYRLRWRFVLTLWNITKQRSNCWIYRDISVKMRFRTARLIATKFTSIKSPTRITAKIYCRAKRRIPSHRPYDSANYNRDIRIINRHYRLYHAGHATDDTQIDFAWSVTGLRNVDRYCCNPIKYE